MMLIHHFNIQNVKQVKKGRQAGFTLLELMVALAIFAVLSLTAWQVFSGLMKTRDRANIYAARLLQWQNTYEQLLRDTTQILARPSVDATGAPQFALQIDSASLAFNRMNAPIAGGQEQNQSSTQHIRYALVDGKLWRLVYSQLDNSDEVPLKTLMLSGVSAFSVQALNPDRVGNWPTADMLNNVQQYMATQAGKTSPALLEQLSLLPKAIEIKVTTFDTPLLWLFSLAGQATPYTGLTSPNSPSNVPTPPTVPNAPTSPALPVPPTMPMAERNFL